VGASYKDAPDKVKSVLRDVVLAVPGVIQEPRPIIYLKSYGDFSINYEIKCYIEDYVNRPVIEDRIMHRIWYAFRRAGIEIPFPTQTSYEYKMPSEPDAAAGPIDLKAVLGGVSVFEHLSEEERGHLAERASLLDFGTGEAIVRQGEPGDSLYVVVSGAVRVALRERRRRGADSTFGPRTLEMALLTGSHGRPPLCQGIGPLPGVRAPPDAPVAPRRRRRWRRSWRCGSRSSRSSGPRPLRAPRA
jgi:hypothetical protein